jgi:hypothetical protein
MMNNTSVEVRCLQEKDGAQTARPSNNMRRFFPVAKFSRSDFLAHRVYAVGCQWEKNFGEFFVNYEDCMICGDSML